MATEIESLSEIGKIFASYKPIIDYKKRTGDYYNIFSVINMQSDEVNLHSRFIADLLNPKALHGCEDAFLRKFVEKLLPYVNSRDEATDDNAINLDFNSAQVIREKYIGPIIDDPKPEGGKIDVFVELEKGKTKSAIVIENKIWAKDQNHQLLRYKNFVENEYKKNWIILYLTLDGHNPESYSYSTGSDDEDKYWINISYKDFILDWINDCINIAAEKHIIRQTLVQYRDIVNKFFGYTEVIKEMEDKLDDKLAEPEVFNSVLVAWSHLEKAKVIIAKKLIDEIENKLKKENAEIQVSGAFTADQYSGITFFKNPKEDNNLVLTYDFEDSKFSKLIFGIRNVGGSFAEEKKHAIKEIKEKFGFDKVSDAYLCYRLFRNGERPVYSDDNPFGLPLLYWNNAFFNDLNQHTSDYAEYFVNQAKEIFGLLE